PRRQIGEGRPKPGSAALGGEEDLLRKAITREEWGNLLNTHAGGAGEASRNIILEDTLVQEGHHKSRIAKVVALVGQGNRATQEGKVRHQGHEHKATGTDNARQFCGAITLAGVNEVIERAERERSIERGVRPA